MYILRCLFSFVVHFQYKQMRTYASIINLVFIRSLASYFDRLERRNTFRSTSTVSFMFPVANPWNLIPFFWSGLFRGYLLVWSIFSSCLCGFQQAIGTTFFPSECIMMLRVSFLGSPCGDGYKIRFVSSPSNLKFLLLPSMTCLLVWNRLQNKSYIFLNYEIHKNK